MNDFGDTTATGKNVVLVVGAGGREHAIAWKLSASPEVDMVYVAPGNPGMFLSASNIRQAKISDIPVQQDDVDAMVRFCRLVKCSLVVIGPEACLANGTVDQLQQAGILVVGPSQSAARLESSKKFGREVIAAAGVPGPRYLHVSGIEQLKDVIAGWHWGDGLVIKADGLAAGKGVFVCRSRDDATSAVDALVRMDKDSSGKILRDGLVCEELLSGREISAFALCDGGTHLAFGMACDHKRLLDGDAGPNTGGMGAYSPVGWVSDDIESELGRVVFQPVLREMARRGIPFHGFLFAGLMMTDNGPRVLEFNTRLGDPETQVLLPRLETDFYQLLAASAAGQLREKFPDGLRWKSESAVHVVKVAEGYPGVDGTMIRRGDPIQFSPSVVETDAAPIELKPAVFFSGVTAGHEPDSLLTSGGRVLGVTALGTTLAGARAAAYQQLDEFHFTGAAWRKDIGN